MNRMPPSTGPVLVVDDDPLLSGMAARTLRHAGFEVCVAASGEEALALFDGARFALVLLDVMMPGLDGYETCTRLRAMPQGATVPVLMLTGLNDTASIEHAYQAGATDFIVKPIHWTLLAQRVRYAIRAAASAESALLNRERLERAQRIASMGNWEMSVDGSTMACSAVFESLFGRAGDGSVARSPAALLDRVHADDRQRVHAAREAALQAGVPYQLSFRIHRFDGGERTVFEQALPVFDSVGRQRGVEGITQDITERVEAERRASQLARYDRITGLPNRDFFAELAAPALERTARLGTRCALLHLDIDQFKSVNDALGTVEGDGILRLIGERLAACLRVADLAGAAGEACVARVGANTFTLLLVDSGDERQAAAVVERLQRAVSQPIAVRGRELTLTASVGVALYPRDSREVKRLLSCAEQACYAAKAAGRGQQRFFDEAMNAAASARLLRESELRRAIVDGQLRLHYQPKVDAVAGRTIGAEALVRWQHPERGLVPPGEFIALAEESGLIVELTEWVLATACADQRRRLDAGLPALPVSVNIAGTSFMRDDLSAELDGLLQRHGLDASCLVLEVTESMLMKDVQLAIERLQQLRARGFRISLDDFGTGYSSLSYLQRFAIDELKIDRSFVADAAQGGRGSAIARSIIALGREFGLDVVAEGVETASQAELLIQHGCRTHQGFLFARPMSRAEFDERLTRESSSVAV